MEYIQAHSREGRTSHGSYGVKVMVMLGRELNENDSRIIDDAAETIAQELLAESIRLNPETAVRRAEVRAQILALFADRIYVEEIPNGYCSLWCCRQLPWFVVTTPIGRIKVGWRKSVILIDWTETVVKQSGEELFPDEYVTKETRATMSAKYEKERYIHAWGYEKAAAYIAKLMAAKDVV